MQRIRLGRTGVRVPPIGLGTWSYGGARTDEIDDPVGWSGQDDRRSLDALVRAWELGLTHWDTADVYGDGHAEELIGSLWGRVPREEIFLGVLLGQRAPVQVEAAATLGEALSADDAAWVRRTFGG